MKFTQNYGAFIKLRIKKGETEHDSNLNYWQDQLFLNFLVYCLPVSLVALIPGVFMAWQEEVISITIVDVACFLMLTYITFSKNLPFMARKIIVLVFSIFYPFF